ncbi:MAG TPA: hypothetical protein VM243_21115 [Phycisphaerae bacterium]|nr:hypothetical protein [Phycisphaerae bacterium]
MRFKGCAKVVALLAGAVLCWTGCASTPRGTGADDATTPQDKAHQEQLAEMSEEDSQEAEKPAGSKKRSADPSSRSRRSGQRVIDQPTRP